MTPEFKVRQANPEDLGFVFATWRAAHHRTRTPEERRAHYFHGHAVVIETLLERSVVLVACNPKDPTHLLGHVVGEPRNGLCVVHYAYVKKPVRRVGIGRALMLELLERTSYSDAGNRNVVVTHEGPPWLQRLVKRRRWSQSYSLPFYRTIEAIKPHEETTT